MAPISRMVLEFWPRMLAAGELPPLTTTVLPPLPLPLPNNEGSLKLLALLVCRLPPVVLVPFGQGAL